MYFSQDNLVLTAFQAACVALPAAGLPRWGRRLQTGAWALVLPLSVAVVVGAIAIAPATADVLTWVALLLVPLGCALALGWAMRGARPVLALLGVPLLALAWAVPHDRWGEAATALLITGSAVTAGRLLAGAAPLTLLKAGVVAMAVVDAILVFSDNLQAPNALLVAASPGGGLPRLQSASFGFAGLGYGDFFAAAVVGAILAAEHRRRLTGAVAMLLVTLAWDQLFLLYDVLPATVPPALVLVGFELWARTRRPAPRRGRGRPDGAPARAMQQDAGMDREGAVRQDRLAARVALITGAIFVVAALPKFLAYGWELDNFRRFGLPEPSLWVIAAGVLELAGGVLLMARRWVVPAAAVLAVVMVVAIAVSGVAQGDVVPSLTVAPLLLAALIVLLARRRRPRMRPG